MNRKIWLIGCGILVVLLALVFFSVNSNVIKDGYDEVSMRLPIPVINAHFTQYFVGYDKGFYDDENLEVILSPGSPDTNPIKMVAAGVDDFGLAGGPELVLMGRDKGLPLVAVATIHRNSDFPIIIAPKDSGISTVKDLEDKKLGFFYGHISTDVIRSLLGKEGVGVEEVSVGFDYTQLYTGHIDAEHAFRSNMPIIEAASGMQFNIISPRDSGINTHGLTIFTTEQMIEEHPEVVERFLRAIVRGTEYTLGNPENALQSILERTDNLNPELELETLEIFMGPMSNSEKYPVGYMDYEMFKETYDRLVEGGIISEGMDVNAAFTTEFLDRIHSQN